MEYPVHLYMTLYPNNALIASQLNVELFARHYTTGSSRHYRGKVIFAELDPDYRHPYFDMEKILGAVAPHEDGRPKATKFIASYRVLEHVDSAAITRLCLATQEGYCITLDSGPFESEEDGQNMHLFAEIAPLRMLVLSDVGFVRFGRYITDPRNPKSAPRQFYTRLDLDVLAFIGEIEENPFRPSPIANVHPSTLRDGFYELKRYQDKHHKGIALDSNLDQVSYKLIRKGFMVSTQNESKFFPMPSSAEIEERAYKFWRTM